MKKIRVSHSIGDTVYIVNDPDACPRIVTRIMITPAGAEYAVRYADREPTWHFGIELKRRGRETIGFTK